jgi:hypothetical protein
MSSRDRTLQANLPYLRHLENLSVCRDDRSRIFQLLKFKFFLCVFLNCVPDVYLIGSGFSWGLGTRTRNPDQDLDPRRENGTRKRK